MEEEIERLRVPHNKKHIKNTSPDEKSEQKEEPADLYHFEGIFDKDKLIDELKTRAKGRWVNKITTNF